MQESSDLEEQIGSIFSMLSNAFFPATDRKRNDPEQTKKEQQQEQEQQVEQQEEQGHEGHVREAQVESQEERASQARRYKESRMSDNCCFPQTALGRLNRCLTVTTIVVFFTSLLVGLSISRVHYYQYSFAKSRIGGSIDRSKVYGAGRYFLNPDTVFVSYDATTVSLEFQDLNVWSRAGLEDAGTPLEIDVNIQYRLIKDDLAQLYEKVGLVHEPFVRNLVTNAVKNAAVSFSADEYLTLLEVIETEMFKAVAKETKEAAGVRVTSLQLMHVKFPDSFYARKLEAAVQAQKNLIEDYKKVSTLVRGNTTVDVARIDNQATEVREVAKANASLLQQNANNEAIRIRGEAERIGLVDTLSKALNITDQKDILNLNYLVNIMQKGANKKYINFAQAPEPKALV